MKEIRDVLENLDWELDGIQTKGTRKASKDRAEAEIKKIVLGWVGEDKEVDWDEAVWKEKDYSTRGYNIAKAEIRKTVEGDYEL